MKKMAFPKLSLSTTTTKTIAHKKKEYLTAQKHWHINNLFVNLKLKNAKIYVARI